MDRIIECNHVEEIYRYLAKVPLEVNELYDDSWNRATGDLGSHKADLAREIVTWIFYAETVLSVETLGEILLSAGFGNVVDRVPEQEVLSACAGLVRVESLARPMRNLDDGLEASVPRDPDQIVTFSHASIYHYFKTRKESLFPFGDDHIVARCLATSTSGEALEAVPGVHLAITW